MCALRGTHPDGKVHGAYMGPIWGRQVPGGPHVDPMNFSIWDCITVHMYTVIVIRKTIGQNDVTIPKSTDITWNKNVERMDGQHFS